MTEPSPPPPLHDLLTRIADQAGPGPSDPRRSGTGPAGRAGTDAGLRHGAVAALVPRRAAGLPTLAGVE